MVFSKLKLILMTVALALLMSAYVLFEATASPHPVWIVILGTVAVLSCLAVGGVLAWVTRDRRKNQPPPKQ